MNRWWQGFVWRGEAPYREDSSVECSMELQGMVGGYCTSSGWKRWAPNWLLLGRWTEVASVIYFEVGEREFANLDPIGK